MPTKTKVKVNVSISTLTLLSGIALFAAAVFGFMKTEIDPTINDNLPSAVWRFLDSNNYNYDQNQIAITNNVVHLNQNQKQAVISNKNPYSCYPHPAMGFSVNQVGNIKYQLSKDNLNWYYWDQKQRKWLNADSLDKASEANQIQPVIRYFYPMSLKQFYFKAIFDSNDQFLDKVELRCDVSFFGKLQLYPQSL